MKSKSTHLQSISLVWFFSFFLFACLSPVFLCAQTPINYGDCTQSSIDSPAEIDVYTFSGNANDIITMQMSRSSGSLWPRIEIFDPNGMQIKVVSNVPSVRIDTLKLLISGTYTIFALDGFNGTLTGEYSLYLQRTFNPSQATEIATGSVLSSTIDHAGCIDAYVFSASTNNIVTIQMARSSGSLWPRIELYSPDGSLISVASNVPSSRIDMTLPVTGSYIILALDGFNGTLTGTYSLSLTGLITSIEDEPRGSLPAKFELSQNYPNPFNPTTLIRYQLPTASNVALEIYTPLGQKIKILVNRQQAAGTYQVYWDGRNDQGERQSSGLYFYRLVADNFIRTHKMVLMR